MYGICESGYVWMYALETPDISDIKRCMNEQKLMSMIVENGMKQEVICFLPLSIELDDGSDFNVVCKFIGGANANGTLCIERGDEGGDIHFSSHDVWPDDEDITKEILNIVLTGYGYTHDERRSNGKSH